MATCSNEADASSRLHLRFALEFLASLHILQEIALRFDPGRCACCDASVHAGVAALRAALDLLDERAGRGAERG